MMELTILIYNFTNLDEINVRDLTPRLNKSYLVEDTNRSI